MTNEYQMREHALGFVMTEPFISITHKTIWRWERKRFEALGWVADNDGGWIRLRISCEKNINDYLASAAITAATALRYADDFEDNYREALKTLGVQRLS